MGLLKSRSDAKKAPFIYSAPMDRVTGRGMIRAMTELNHYAVSCRFFSSRERTITRSNFRGNKNLFYSIGLSDIELSNAISSGKTGNYKQNLSLDIAHGDSLHAHKLTKKMRESNNIMSIMSGSICTIEGAERAILNGCTHLRIGIGGGSACTTRIMTGCGAPNLSAVFRINKYLSKKFDRKSFKIIADGGIKTPGDAVKYLAAGADGIMLGNILARASESSGWLLDKDRNKYKEYRGQASLEFQKENINRTPRNIEGITCGVFTPEYTVEEIVKNYEEAVQSAISYLGITSIDDLQPENVTFIKVTQNGYIEGTPHGKI